MVRVATNGGAPRATETTDSALSLAEVADQLGLHYMTVYRYVRIGRLEATKVAGEWRVDPAAIDRMTNPGPAPTMGTRLTARRQLEQRLLAADEGGSWTIFQSALASGATPRELHEGLLIPSMQSIGQRWADGDISILDEHRATTVASRLVSRLGPSFRQSGRRRGIVILGVVVGDLHGMPTAIIADLLRGERFDVIDLGANTPPESFAEAVRTTDGAVLVGVSASCDADIRSVRETVATIRSTHADIPILVGGASIPTADLAEELGASGYARTPTEILDTVEALVS